jgi:hypothetical protein
VLVLCGERVRQSRDLATQLFELLLGIGTQCAAVAAWCSVSSCATRSTTEDANVAVTAPTSPMPPTIIRTATTRPSPVTGDSSPYRTVVTVLIDHHTASPNVVIRAPGCDLSA